MFTVRTSRFILCAFIAAGHALGNPHLQSLNEKMDENKNGDGSTAVAKELFAEELAAVESLSGLTTAPAFSLATGYAVSEQLRAIYFDALAWKGRETKVFAWIGLPEETGEKVPGVVLVHGGGGTAFKNWVKEWNQRGFAAIAIAVEGQTDRRLKEADGGAVTATGWERHEWAGPERRGIYHDSGEPIRDQWMYHAVAGSILANSLLRSLPQVDAGQVGIMGVSWGGVITSTVIGLDERFAFAVPTYGCGGLATAENQYGRSLGNNRIYRQVWDPVLRLQRAKMPTLWFSWPEDEHFPMDCFAASYGQLPGPHMVSLVPGMGHGHGPAWTRPEAFAIAQGLVSGSGLWCVQTGLREEGGLVEADFSATEKLDSAVLVSTTDSGVSSSRTWVETPAKLSRNGTSWTASANLPEGTTAWFLNVIAAGVVASSDYCAQE